MSELKVIFGKHNVDAIRDQVTLLELDTFDQPGLAEPVTVYAVVEPTAIPPITSISNGCHIARSFPPDKTKPLSMHAKLTIVPMMTFISI